MKEQLIQLVRDSESNKLNIMREYLQMYILRQLQECGFFASAYFVGGTALRMIYGVPRFSEDLDFSSYGKKIDWQNIIEKIGKYLTNSGYSVSVKTKTGVVLSAMIGFNDIMFDCGLSPHKKQKISVKLEVDTKPPEGGKIETSVVNKYMFITLAHYDLKSLFTGKINALLTRSYMKGRDVYDIFWCKTKWGDICPNETQLTNSLKQYGIESDSANWKQLVKEKISGHNWSDIAKDVENFVEDTNFKSHFTKEHFLSCLALPGPDKNQ